MQIETRHALDEALAADAFLLLKHSYRCGVSRHAFNAYQAFTATHDIAHGWIDVLEHRDLSDAIAQHTGIRHESPQAILLRDGKAAWHATHFDISEGALKEAV